MSLDCQTLIRGDLEGEDQGFKLGLDRGYTEVSGEIFFGILQVELPLVDDFVVRLEIQELYPLSLVFGGLEEYLLLGGYIDNLDEVGGLIYVHLKLTDEVGFTGVYLVRSCQN